MADSTDRIAVLGAGTLGRALAGRLCRAGLDVVVGSRDAARGVAYAEAVAGASIVVLAIGYEDLSPVLDQLRPLLSRQVVIDPTTPWGGDVEERSAAERIAALLPPGVPLVGAWKASYASLLDAEPGQGAVVHDVLLCGDDDAANERVSGLIRRTHCRPVDCGPLAAARTIEGMVRLMSTIRGRLAIPADADTEWKFVP